MKVTVNRHDLRKTGAEDSEYRVYGVERIEVPEPTKPVTIPVPETSKPPGVAYRLVLKDHAGKQIGRGSL
jgi:hypothetical protein